MWGSTQRTRGGEATSVLIQKSRVRIFGEAPRHQDPTTKEYPLYFEEENEDDEDGSPKRRIRDFWIRTLAVLGQCEVVGVLGFEPRSTESESVVLPLDDTPNAPHAYSNIGRV